MKNTPFLLIFILLLAIANINSTPKENNKIITLSENQKKCKEVYQNKKDGKINKGWYKLILHCNGSFTYYHFDCSPGDTKSFGNYTKKNDSIFLYTTEKFKKIYNKQLNKPTAVLKYIDVDGTILIQKKDSLVSNKKGNIIHTLFLN